MDAAVGIFQFLLLHNYCIADDNSEFLMSMTTNVFIDLVCFANSQLVFACFFMLTLHLPAAAPIRPSSSCLSFPGNERRLCVLSCLLCFHLFLCRKRCRQTRVLAAHVCLCLSNAASHHLSDNWKRLHTVSCCMEGHFGKANWFRLVSRSVFCTGGL